MSTNPVKFLFIQGPFSSGTVDVFPIERLLSHIQGWGRNLLLFFQEQKQVLKINVQVFLHPGHH